eukprot:2367444-Pleurochrysis_carterae.AAC.1
MATVDGLKIVAMNIVVMYPRLPSLKRVSHIFVAAADGGLAPTAIRVPGSWECAQKRHGAVTIAQSGIRAAEATPCFASCCSGAEGAARTLGRSKVES